MKFRIFLVTLALLFGGSAYSHAALTQQDQQTSIKADTGTQILEAKRGRGRGGDAGKGRGRGGDRVKSTDDNGSGSGSGSGRKKPRVPGGSGCDDAGDVAEHASCG